MVTAIAAFKSIMKISQCQGTFVKKYGSILKGPIVVEIPACINEQATCTVYRDLD